MSEPDKDQKTEEPTQKKLDDARAKGDVASAPEMRHAAMFLGLIIVAGGLGAWSLSRLGAMFVRLWGGADDFPIEPTGAQNLIGGVMAHVAMSLAPIGGVLVGCALLTIFLQGRPTMAWSRVGFKWSKLSPIAGFGRLLGKRALVEFAKTLAKFSAIGIVAFMVAWPKAVALDQLIGAPAGAIGQTAMAIIYKMIKMIALLVFVIALADFIYQRRAFMQKMRMSLQELKDEMKQSDGDPQIKAKIRQIRMQRARRRMMTAVPTASVIITNPTHYAVALKYEHGDMAAPVVVAKGVDEVALKIREIAGAHKVPIVESPPLARALYAAVDIDHPIPTEHYAAVAEIIGYVMRLARRIA
ncbi:flagellar biosynthesis protein FlhB [Sphingomonas sp. KC8]|uniref:flagellar biosynthesis protein FlhB n=1 Tax=Sphingomonas sp. KC8 TaxID=1030157 RepID=UPI0002488F1E|nr:flagellar biosynthesis protein FlhB [Sphingomonas sp. KC8]ARS28991.1 flagellar biosynthetic protein FlhB [Sphingomonas sp. KC8]